MLDIIRKAFQDSLELRQAILKDEKLMVQIRLAAEKIVAASRQGGTIYTCGNGGSACDAMHFAEELVARYKRERPGIKAMHLADAGTLTCWANDCGYNTVFARQVETFCTSKDLLVVFSTSGVSASALAAAKAARQKGTFVVALTGKSGGELKDLSDLAIVIPSNATERIQEVHITLVHIFCELLET